MAADWTFEGTKAVMVALLSLAGGIASEKYRRSKSRNTRAAAYLESIAAALEEMAESFERREIPYSGSNKLNTLIDAFEDTTRRHIGEELLGDTCGGT